MVAVRFVRPVFSVVQELRLEHKMARRVCLAMVVPLLLATVPAVLPLYV